MKYETSDEIDILKKQIEDKFIKNNMNIDENIINLSKKLDILIVDFMRKKRHN
ncbi:Spo0E family sporulation regulatory protein-aspartic acid phosphatase [Tepidibacter mesophilus]|uniref:Spo0E family sporulation regulatory protein-aspartic acid phosphatase n=1 Tax=Tepidibacter mesophilus TaxID=655607 RepID=UPI001650FDA1|nr:Spo0E family sporulation regulatory protein-aspartic acid phosphatase [Tepidibacter mesophilus]